MELPGVDDNLTSVPGREEYAIKVDINSPVDDFYKRIPDMAYKVPCLFIQYAKNLSTYK